MPTFRQRLKPRFAVLGLVVLGVIGVLLFRLWSMQVLSGHAYATQAEDNRVREITLEAPRGRILDRNGRPLVTNRMTMAVTSRRRPRTTRLCLPGCRASWASRSRTSRNA